MDGPWVLLEGINLWGDRFSHSHSVPSLRQGSQCIILGRTKLDVDFLPFSISGGSTYQGSLNHQVLEGSQSRC